MMKICTVNIRKNCLRFCFFWLMLAIQQVTQAQVNVQIRIMPPYLSRVSDYASRPDLMLLTLTNTSRNSLRIQLRGSITGDNGVSASVKDSYRSPQPVELAPLETKTLNASDIVSLFNPNTIDYTGISASDINRGFILPEGTYNICVRALEYDGHEPLSPEEPIGCKEFNISNVEPPIIISPANEQELSSLGPQAFPITWSTPPGSSPATQYHVRMVEMLSPRNPNDAMQSSTTPAFFERTVQGNTLLYGPADPQLTPGRQYALMVQAEDPFNSVTFRNGGKSEVITFSYIQPVSAMVPDSLNVDKRVIYKKDTIYKDTTRISGQLLYRFAHDSNGKTYPVSHEQVFLKRVFVRETMGSDSVAHYEPLDEESKRALSSESSMLDGLTAETDENGNFNLTCLLSSLDSAGVIPTNRLDYYGASGLANNSGTGNLAMLYQLETTNPYYKPYAQYLHITPGGRQDLTAVVLNANSYTLRVNVQEAFESLKGNYVAGAHIKLYRKSAYKNDIKLGIPKYEGDITDDNGKPSSSESDKILIAERVTPNPGPGAQPEAYTVSFERLFRSLDAEPYQYEICLEDATKVVTESSFGEQESAPADSIYAKWQSFLYNGQPDTTWLALTKELVSPPRSRLTGKLQYTYKTDKSMPPTPYANMPVKLVVFYLMDKDETPAVPTNITTAARPITSTFSVGATAFATQNIRSMRINQIGMTPMPYMAQEVIDNYKPPVIDHTTKRISGTIFINGQYKSDNLKVLQTVMTDADGNFTFDFPNSDYTGISENGSLTTGSGEFRSDTYGKVTRVYRIVPDNTYYCAPDNDIILQPWQNTDCGTLNSYVQTFNLKVHVQKVEKLDHPETLTDFPNVPINIYRVANSPLRSEWPVVQGIDINKEMLLSITKNVSVANTSTQNISTTNKAYNSIRTIGKRSIGSLPTRLVYLNSAFLPSTTTTLSSYILFRQGASTGDGTVIFPNVVKSKGKENDIILIEADNKDREGSTAFQKAYLEFPDTKNLSTRSESENLSFGPDLPGQLNSNDISSVVFNSEFDPNTTQDTYLRILPEPATVRGRITDNSTTLGIKGVTMRLEVSINNKGVYFYTETDDNGYYKFDDLSSLLTSSNPYFPYNIYSSSKGRSWTTLSVLSASGYTITPSEGFQTELGALDMGRSGRQYVWNTALAPAANNAFGYVIDADNHASGVAARVKLKINGRWTDTYSYTGNKMSPAPKVNNDISFGFLANSVKAAVNNNVIQQSQSRVIATPTVTPLGTLGSLSTQVVSGTRITKLTVGPTVSIGKRAVVNVATQISQFSPNTLTVQEVTASHLNPLVVSAPVTPVVTLVDNLQRFDIDLPARPDSILILPYDPAYMPRTVGVNPGKADEYLGDFALTKRKHRMLVRVMDENGNVVPNVRLRVEGPDSITAYSNLYGNVKIEFSNNATDNFTIWADNGNQEIDPKNSNLIVPTVKSNIVSPDDNKMRIVLIRVKRAELLKGRVTMADSGLPVKNALVYQDEGTGGQSSISTTTTENGEYTLLVARPELRIIQRNRVKDFPISIKTAYSEPGKTFIGSSIKYQSKSYRVGGSDTLNLTISEVKDIDVSKLYGFPVRISEMKRSDDGLYHVSGEIFGKLQNGNFAVTNEIQTDQVLPFNDLAIKPSNIHNAAGVPLAVPVENRLDLNMRKIRINAFGVFMAEASAPEEESMCILKSGSDTTGILSAKVRIVNHSFNFPSSYMTISDEKDFFLGNYGLAAGSEKVKIPVFRTDLPYPLKQFSLSTDNGGPINFKYLGFDGLTDQTGNRESFILGDSINLFMNLSSTIQGNIPINLQAGKAVLRHDRLERIETNDSLKIDLEKWQLRTNSWELSNTSGGIVMHDLTLYTGRADLKIPQMTLIPGELICPSMGSGASSSLRNNFYLGGAAHIKLNVNPLTEIVFMYDPDVGRIAGQGHYKLSLKSDEGQAAYIQGLDGMTNPNERLDIQYMSLLSNDEEVFGFNASSNDITLYKQLSFKPRALYSNFDRLVLSGTMSLHLPNVPDNIAVDLTYLPGEKALGGSDDTPQLNIGPLKFDFKGPGGTLFTSLNNTASQVFKTAGLGIAGLVQLPGQAQALKANLVSMVTETAQQQADLLKKQVEVVLGEYKKEAHNMAADVIDEVMQDAGLNEMRSEIEAQLNEINNTFHQMIPIGEIKQQMKELSAKWKLVGQGMDAINNIDKNPIGSLLQLNGVIDGFTGINLANEAKQEAKMVAMEALKGLQDELPVQKISDAANGAGDSFSGMKFDFDFKNGRIFGSLSMPKLDAGAVSLTKLGIEVLFDPRGWYFYAGANINVRAVPLIFPLGAGICIGSYPEISPALEQRITEVSYVRKLPAIYHRQGINGFFMTGRKDIIEEVKFGVNFWVADFEVAAMAGLDGRIYAEFGPDMEIGIGAMLFARAYAKLAVLGGACGIKGDASAELGTKFAFANTGGDPSFTAAACTSINLNASAWCLFVSGHIGVGFQALMKFCAGNCQKHIEFNLRYTSEKCSESNDFDY
ncbi:hypothetical protein SAMN05216436_105185 [bacterium A37T11]|nr:hypothetical protein SAMN05216436_105185 [bacterium A37T11]